MAISNFWRESWSDRWSVAQIKASLEDVVQVLETLDAYRDSRLELTNGEFVLADDDTPTVAYSLDGQPWTFFEDLNGHLDSANLGQASEILQANLLVAGFEDNNGFAAFEFFEQGRLVEAYMLNGGEHLNPKSEFYDPQTSDGIEREWICDPFFNHCLFTERELPDDFEIPKFEERWDEISSELGLTVPPRLWAVCPPRRIVPSTKHLEAQKISAARVLDWGSMD